MGRDRFYHAWIGQWMQASAVPLWGTADVSDISVPPAVAGKRLYTSISWAIPMPPKIMAGIKDGPTREYAQAYLDVNLRINYIAKRLAADIGELGFQAVALAASERTDPVNIRGDFPHKTAATLSGVGWVGRHCQLVTRQFGPWVRLGTVFTDMPMVYGRPFTRGFCGTCRACVDACPAGALTGKAWKAGIEREEILDAAACDRWKKEHYLQFSNGHNCGICSAVCPYGLKQLGRITEQPNNYKNML